MLKHDVGNRIRYLRNKLGLSQEKLALKSDLDRTYLAGIESGKRNATLDSVEKSKNDKIKENEVLRCSDLKDFFDFELDVDYK